MKTRKHRRHYQTRGMLHASAIKMLIDMPSHAVAERDGTFRVIASMPYTAIAQRGPAVTKEFARAVGDLKPWDLFLFCGSSEEAQAHAQHLQQFSVTLRSSFKALLTAPSLTGRSTQASEEAHHSMATRVAAAVGDQLPVDWLRPTTFS